MLETLANLIGLGYLMVLAILGYVILLTIIRKIFNEDKKTLRILITSFHYIFGICAVLLFPSLYLRDNSNSFGLIDSFVFALIVILGIIMVFYAINYLNKHIEWK